jgi:hypothetical protein
MKKPILIIIAGTDPQLLFRVIDGMIIKEYSIIND